MSVFASTPFPSANSSLPSTSALSPNQLIREAAAAQVELYCRKLRLPSLKQGFTQVVREAIVNNQHPLDFLVACLSLEADGRMQRLLQKRIKQARFPATKTLDRYDFSLVPDLSRPRMLDLAEGGFIQEKDNVVILGPSGLGKTHLAIGIGMGAILAGYQVRFTTAAALAQELRLAHKELRLPKLLKGYSRQELVIVDELGYVSLAEEGSLLFQFFAERYERGSVLITSNLEFSRWGEIFGDPTMTAALLDRLTHHAHLLVLNGESYRFRQSRDRQRREQA